MPRMLRAMDRVLEPEVMDTRQDAEDYDAMDFREPNERFANDALELVHGVPHPRVLDIGTGTARIPLLMLDRHPTMEVLAIDLADSMLDVARRNVEAAGHQDRCDLLLMDAKAMELPSSAGEPRSIELVMCNSVAHHVPEPLHLFQEIARVAAPHAAILVRDLMRPDSEAAAREIVERVSPEANDHQKQLFFESLRAALTVEEVAGLARRAGLDDLRIEAISDRHWTAERPARPTDSET